MSYDPLLSEPIAVGGITLGATATDITVPVVSGDLPGRIIIRGRIIGDSATTRVYTVRINGSATNVSIITMRSDGASVVAATDSSGVLQTNNVGSSFEFVIDTSKGAGLNRQGHGHAMAAGAAPALWTFGIRYADTTTTITDITIHCNTASGFGAGTAISWAEYRLP